MLFGEHVGQVGPAFVERIAVFMMAYLIIRGLCDDSVHANRDYLAVSDRSADGVVAAAGFDGSPIVLIELVKPVGVNDCEHSL